MSGEARVLLVMYKPGGADRVCAVDEVERIVGAWASILGWLRGRDDPDELPHAELVGRVARKAGLRMTRFGAYDISAWAGQARTLPNVPSVEIPSTCRLPQLTRRILEALALQRVGEQRCWLNRVAIELLYGDSHPFVKNRDQLVPLLLQGPVFFEQWLGTRMELAHAVKLLIRPALSAQPITNMIHMELIDPVALGNLADSLAVPLG